MATYNQLKYGSTGDDVKKMQETLNQNGYNLDVDGVFGDKTLAAVKDYQTKNGLAVDGIAGNNTLGKLYSTQTNNQMAATQTPSASETPTVQQPNKQTGGFTYEDYSKSDAVLQAEALLNQHNANKPGAYQSQWQDEIDDYLNQYQNRDQFSYDLNSDALYQQYKDQYIQQGRMAMMDAMGQASVMTGGYGNSYAQTVGQQVYNQNLNQLNNIMPELYDMAYGRHVQEGQDLLNMYNMYLDRENQDYGRYRDDLNAWEAERAHLEGNYNTERDLDYSEYIADKDRAWDQYLMDMEKEQAAAELMASTGDYERLKDIYGLTDDELAAIKDATKPKGGGGGNPNPSYRDITTGDADWLENKFKRMSYTDAVKAAGLYAKTYGFDPALVLGIASLVTGGPPQPEEIPPIVPVDDLVALKARQEEIRKQQAAGNMTRR